MRKNIWEAIGAGAFIALSGVAPFAWIIVGALVNVFNLSISLFAWSVLTFAVCWVYGIGRWTYKQKRKETRRFDEPPVWKKQPAKPQTADAFER